MLRLTKGIQEACKSYHSTYSLHSVPDLASDYLYQIKESVGKPSAGSNSELEKRENAVNVEALVKKCVGNDKSYIVITAEICARFAYLVSGNTILFNDLSHCLCTGNILALHLREDQRFQALGSC